MLDILLKSFLNEMKKIIFNHRKRLNWTMLTLITLLIVTKFLYFLLMKIISLLRWYFNKIPFTRTSSLFSHDDMSLEEGRRPARYLLVWKLVDMRYFSSVFRLFDKMFLKSCSKSKKDKVVQILKSKDV